jgi:hypothetical protein
MKITSNKHVEDLKSALSISRALGVEAVVVTGWHISGITSDHKAAIISPLNLEIDPNLKLGIGRINELEKRLALFGAEATIEGKLKDEDVLMLTIAEGRSKIQYRCTAERLIKYPKENVDPVQYLVVLSKGEAVQLSKAVRTLAAETVVLKIGRDGTVGFECIDPQNEQFSIDLALKADFMGDVTPTVVTYRSTYFTTLIELVAKGAEKIELAIGEGGSATGIASGFSIITFPHTTGEEDE